MSTCKQNFLSEDLCSTNLLTSQYCFIKFYDTSTIAGYVMPNLFYACILNI